MTNSLTRTGKQIKFECVGVGCPFYAGDSFWIRTSRNSATKLTVLGLTDIRIEFAVQRVIDPLSMVERVKIEYHTG